MFSKSLVQVVVVSLGMFSFSLGAHAACYSSSGVQGSCQFTKENIEGIVFGGMFTFDLMMDLFKKVEEEAIPGLEDVLKLRDSPNDIQSFLFSKMLFEHPCTSGLGLITTQEKVRAQARFYAEGNLFERMKIFEEDFLITKTKPYFELAKAISDSLVARPRVESDDDFQRFVASIKDDVIPRYMAQKGLSCGARSDL